MRDIFICPHGNMLGNWQEAFPKALASVSLVSVPVNEPITFWLHTNPNQLVWLESTISEIHTKYPVANIVVLANSPSQSEALLALSKGVVGYCHAYSPAEVLKELKTVVIHGGIWVGQELLQNLINVSREVVHNTPVEVDHTLQLLSPREREVALQAATGLSNKAIARALNITERTVKAHISATLEKLGLKDRLQLALVLNKSTSEKHQTVTAATSKKKLELAA